MFSARTQSDQRAGSGRRIVGVRWRTFYLASGLPLIASSGFNTGPAAAGAAQTRTKVARSISCAGGI